MLGDLFPAENMNDAFSRGFLYLTNKVSNCGVACTKQNATNNKMRMDCFVTFVPRNDGLLAAN